MCKYLLLLVWLFRLEPGWNWRKPHRSLGGLDISPIGKHHKPMCRYTPRENRCGNIHLEKTNVAIYTSRKPMCRYIHLGKTNVAIYTTNQCADIHLGNGNVYQIELGNWNVHQIELFKSKQLDRQKSQHHPNIGILRHKIKHLNFHSVIPWVTRFSAKAFKPVYIGASSEGSKRVFDFDKV